MARVVNGMCRYSQGEANKMMAHQITPSDFYKKQINKICHYCNLTEDQIKEFVLLPKAFKVRNEENMEITKYTDCSRGGKRGQTLEVDRKDPCKPYTDDNCVLACYICNNAKSNIFTEEEFKQIGKLFGEIINEKLK